jgi:cobalt-zinc-cadmium efflux system outer membrane protein
MVFRLALSCGLCLWLWLAPGAGLARAASSGELPLAHETGATAALLDSLVTSPSLDLGRLERAVIARNPSLAAMRAAWKQMEAKADVAGSLEDPMVDGMVAPGSLGKETVDPAYSIAISQHVAIFGQRGLRRKSAQAESRSAAEDYRTKGQELLQETRRLYYELYVAARGTEANRELADLLGQFRRIAVQKYAAGTAGQQDALQAEVELARLDHQRVVLGRTRRVVVAQLQALLHDETGRPFPDPPRGLSEAPAIVSPDSAVALAFQLRPELRGQTALRDARAVDLRLARRDRLPELTLEARYDRFMDMPEWRSAVGIGLNVPFVWGRVGAGIREAKAGLERAEQERLATQDRVLAELREARAGVEETEHEVHIIETGVVPATERALASVRVGYEANRSDFLALLSAERDLASARLDLYQAQAEYRIRLADYERAIGLASLEFGKEVGP